VSAPKTALVTGANRGIGLEVVRQLAQRGWRVFLGARNVAAGEKVLPSIDGDVEVLALDVTNPQSIAQAVRDLGGQVEALDVLVNNAGAIEDGDNSVLSLSTEIVKATFETNTLGPLRVTQAFLPLLQKSAAPRVINVSSGAGQLSDGLQSWSPAYSISKTALNSVTQQFASALPKFAVNCICPGWVRTDMGGVNAPRSVEQGADTIVWLADEAPQNLTGKFLRDRLVIDW